MQAANAHLACSHFAPLLSLLAHAGVAAKEERFFCEVGEFSFIMGGLLSNGSKSYVLNKQKD